jgi:cyclopropane fatty-acyl-phospholipid synthase-like methyltransferase
LEEKDWFKDWFNTPYYHILYKDRNDDDAQFFMRNITSFLQLPKSTHILDLPCGKGRHSVFLNSLGYKVTGGDLSENSIKAAQQFANETLSFKVHDMRKSFNHNYNAVFNLFTSFGYFEDDAEDISILQNIKNGLTENGAFVFDFLNAKKVAANLVKNETKTIDDIAFNINREIKNGFIYKHISFFADGKQHEYTEQVKYLDLPKMSDYLAKVGFEIQHVFGNYALESFDDNKADRLIIVAK